MEGLRVNTGTVRNIRGRGDWLLCTTEERICAGLLVCFGGWMKRLHGGC